VLELAEAAPDELTTINFLMQAPPAPFIPEEWLGKPVFMVIAAYAGDMEEGERVMAPFRAFAEPIADVVGPIPYPVLYDFTAAGAARHGGSVRQLFADDITDEAIDSTLRAIETATSPMCMINYRILGGAMAQVAPGETAFAHRDRKFFIAVLGLWADASEDDRPHRAWTEAAFEEIKSIGVGVYSNFLEQEGEDRIHEAYPGETYNRLAEVKQRYDPTNFFRFNQNIRPAK
jgi:FAD/FMN-containing dehydrogenase